MSAGSGSAPTIEPSDARAAGEGDCPGGCGGGAYGWLNYPGQVWCPKCDYRGARNGWELCRVCLAGRQHGYGRGCLSCESGYVRVGMELKRSWHPRASDPKGQRATKEAAE